MIGNTQIAPTAPSTTNSTSSSGSSPIVRTFYAKVAIVGPTGSGKSYLSKTADKQTTGLINAELKPLPYKTEPFRFSGSPKTWAGFMKNLEDYGNNPEIKRIIIDSQSMAFETLNNEMGSKYVNWDIPKNYNKEVYKYLALMKSIEKDIIILAHDELVKLDDMSKQRRMTVHNKEYEGKIERQYTVVLYTGTRLEKGRPTYFLNTFEEGTSTKTPEGLFPDKNGDNLMEIPNDAAYIFNCVERYYS